MIKNLDFYFDFISPYSYLAYKRLESLNEGNKININYKPILLGGLHNLGKITPPAFNERKLKNMKNDCELVASKNNIEFKWNVKFPINSLYLMRGYLVVDDHLKKKFIEISFDAYWKENLNISEEKIIDAIIKKTGLNKKIRPQKSSTMQKTRPQRSSTIKKLWPQESDTVENDRPQRRGHNCQRKG